MVNGIAIHGQDKVVAFALGFQYDDISIWSVKDLNKCVLGQSSVFRNGRTLIQWYGEDCHDEPVMYFSSGYDPDGSEELLAIFDGNPVTYKTWADQYYDKNIDLASIADIYAHKRVTSQLVQKLNPGLTLELLSEDILEIGYE